MDNLKQYIWCLFQFSHIGVVISALATGVSMFKTTYLVVWIISAVANILILHFTINKLYNYRMIHRSKKKYYLINSAAMITYGAIATITSAVFNALGVSSESILAKIYTFMFYNFKTIHFFSAKRISTPMSALYYTLFYVVVIFIYPFFINKWALKRKEERDKRKIDIN